MSVPPELQRFDRKREAMSDYVMKRHFLLLDDSWDVIVVGGGPAGCAAAIASAREGAKTLLIEATGALGGMGTTGLVPAWCPFTDGEKFVYGALAMKVFETCKAGMPHIAEGQIHGHIPLDPERLKRIYDDMVTKAGASVLFHTMLSAVDCDEDNSVSALILSNKRGLNAYRAKTYVDCTGDADLAVWAGAEYEKGDAEGEMQPASLCFILSNVDSYEYKHGPNLYSGNPDSPIWKILKSGKYPLIPDHHLCQNLIGTDTVGFNAGHLWVDSTDPVEVSRAMIEGRKIAEEIRRALADYHPKAFGDSYMVATASLMGVRESRRIVGDYVLTVDDYRARRSFPDEIARNCYMVDIHTTQEDLRGEIDNLHRAHVARGERYEKGESHGIPYRCLTPKGIRNVLVAGRSISTDHVVQASTRVMPVCLAMGEAAGTAAFLSSSGDGDVHAVNTDELREKLRENGAYLPD